MSLTRPLVVAASLCLTACETSTSPLEYVTSRLELPAPTVAAGDVVMLRVIATNHGSRLAGAGVGCGAGLDVEVRAPDGARSFLGRGQPSICPIFDSNILEPGETDTVMVRWQVPVALGSYTLIGGVKFDTGLAARSAPQSVVVR